MSIFARCLFVFLSLRISIVVVPSSSCSSIVCQSTHRPRPVWRQERSPNDSFFVFKRGKTRTTGVGQRNSAQFFSLFIVILFVFHFFHFLHLFIFLFVTYHIFMLQFTVCILCYRLTIILPFLSISHCFLSFFLFSLFSSFSLIFLMFYNFSQLRNFNCFIHFLSYFIVYVIYQS